MVNNQPEEHTMGELHSHIAADLHRPKRGKPETAKYPTEELRADAQIINELAERVDDVDFTKLSEDEIGVISTSLRMLQIEVQSAQGKYMMQRILPA